MSLATLSERTSAPPLLRPEPVRRRRPRSGLAGMLLASGLKALALVGAPLAVGAWLLLSPDFRIRHLEVSGGDNIPLAWVEETLAPLAGRHLLAVELDTVSRRLEAHPWVAGVELRRELPDRLRVEVLERRPVALLAAGEELLYLDAAGRRIAAASPSQAAEMVTLVFAGSGEVPVASALAVVEELAAARPAWAQGVSRLEILGEGDYRAHTAALAFPLLVRAGRVADGCRRLERALAALPAGVEVGEADLRFPRRVIVRPSSPGAAARSQDAKTSDRRTTEG